MSSSAETGGRVLQGKDDEERWDDDELAGRDDEQEDDEDVEHEDDEDYDDQQDGADADAERQAEHERRANQAEAAVEQGDRGEEPQADAAELDPQLERAEGEGMVTEHAKVSATDPGPEPLPEPEPEPTEPEPDHGPADPQWEAEEERD